MTSRLILALQLWWKIKQIAIFVGSEKRVYALSNQDPFSKAFVMSRGIIGDLQGERVVASPIYKQHFSLATGRCLEDKDQKLLVFPSKIENGKVSLAQCHKNLYHQQRCFTGENETGTGW